MCTSVLGCDARAHVTRYIPGTPHDRSRAVARAAVMHAHASDGAIGVIPPHSNWKNEIMENLGNRVFLITSLVLSGNERPLAK